MKNVMQFLNSHVWHQILRTLVDSVELHVLGNSEILKECLCYIDLNL